MDIKAKTNSPSPVRKKRKANVSKSTPAKNSEIVSLDGHELTVSNKDKVYFPDDKITKGDVINYYQSVHKYILPYLKNRPQSLKRNPHGINDKGFFHKDAGDDAPDWVDSYRIASESAGKNIHYILCNNRSTLLYLNNLGCIELNPWNSRVSAPDNPDYLVVDLDPSDNNTFDQVIDAALVVKEVLDQAGAPAYCKTSGASGLHIYVPLKAQHTYDRIRSFAEIIGRMTAERLPKTTTVERSLSKRKGRIYLDYQQNKKGQTVAAVYSVRPKPGATVSTPLTWKEVKRGLHPADFTIRNMARRLDKAGDLFSGVLKEKINLTKCLKNLEI